MFKFKVRVLDERQLIGRCLWYIALHGLEPHNKPALPLEREER